MKDAGSLESTSIWMATKPLPAYEPLVKDMETDVCIVGAGITGLTTAYLLSKQGKKVIVLDDGPIISGETRRTTAHISNAIDDRYFSMINIHGKKKAVLAAESFTQAIDMVETIVRDEKIACDFERVSGYLFCPPDIKDDILDKELEASHAVGLSAVKKMAHTPFPDFDAGPCLLFPNQGQFHPLHYLTGVAEAIIKNGGKIFAHTRVTDIDEKEEPFTIQTEHNKVVRSKFLVVATNAPINDNAAVFSKQSPYRTFVIGMRIEKGSVPHALFWDTSDPYHYIRMQKDEDHPSTDILIVGGEDHKTGEANDAEKRYERLEKWARTRFPTAKEVIYRWSGQVLETVDGLAMIGKKPGGHERSYIATGDSGQGMTHGTIAGMLLSDLIMGKKNPWEAIYHPGRFRLRSSKKFIKENTKVAKNLICDYIRSGDLKTIEEVPAGHGGIYRTGMKKIALYRDVEGTLFAHTAVCPHKGCLIRWNDGEKSWDCPCHGSRYNAYGEVLNGPTIKPLPPVKAQQ